MFNWVVKVVPQPPDGSGSLGEDIPHAQPAENKSSKDEAKKGKAKVVIHHDEEQTSEESSGQSGMLTWLSNGFANTLPQPTGSPRLSRGNSDARFVNGEEVESNGVIGWIAQGLGKVVPQPDVKYKDRYDPDDVTEVSDASRVEECIAEPCVYLASELPDVEPLPHIPVVEVLSEDEEGDSVPQFPPKMVDWLKNAMPHRVLVPGPGCIEGPQIHRSSLDKRTQVLHAAKGDH
ncbi:uncharacterized protein LOC134021017 isoform X1 [Osmerus eperlanus]|uniref:uncharacterized protein LOC134021017 isoform X1 n=1 Tax=Osmerus eperlanus TaxID=29151 RepID=UPI002E16353F